MNDAKRTIIERIISNPEKVYREMMQTDEGFRKFVKENEGKSIEQLKKDYNIHFDL